MNEQKPSIVVPSMGMKITRELKEKLLLVTLLAQCIPPNVAKEWSRQIDQKDPEYTKKFGEELERVRTENKKTGKIPEGAFNLLE